MKKSPMKATALRGILIFVLIVIAAGISGGYYFAHQWLETYSATVGTTVAQSQNSNNDVEIGQQLQAAIANQQQTITKVNQLFSDPTTYQTQVINDVTIYAAALGLPTPDFSSGSAASGTTTPAAGAAASGGSATTVTVTLPTPINYLTFLKLVRSIEQNLPKMQIASVNLTRNDATTIGTDALTIEVFTK